MKKYLIKPMLICLLGAVISFSLLVHSVYAYDLFFVDNQQTDGEGRTGYLMGTGEDQVKLYTDNTNLKIMITDVQGTGKDLIRFATKDSDLVIKGLGLPEYLGSSYLDAVARASYNLGNFSLSQVKLILGAQWQTNSGGTLHFTSGSVTSYEADTDKVAGMVRFYGSYKLLGIEGE